MYWIPKPTKCPTCGYESFTDPNHEAHPIFSKFCPECLDRFLEIHIPQMKEDTESGRKHPTER